MFIYSRIIRKIRKRQNKLYLNFWRAIYMVEKVLFSDQIFEMKILINLYFLRSPESENPILSGWSVCKTVIGTTQKQLTAKSSNSVLKPFNMQRCYLKVYIKNHRTSLFTGIHKSILKRYEVRAEILFSTF